ncbi:Aste57867_9242 [Aphanomyces stellatus]|uniref:Aste57867_9242 protein n=1 Tax=Aphanomyces stellatus TaxID=120398 RepID=A0A485KMD4_9STRA|nr:hypothetical protein As57867_009206 [Aphanomyces stellatus]VFT86125.1 Aste57867_9242 [Aphanomyces stellatus]
MKPLELQSETKGDQTARGVMASSPVSQQLLMEDDVSLQDGDIMTQSTPPTLLSPTKKAFASKIPRRRVELAAPAPPKEAPSTNQEATPPKAGLLAKMDKHQQYIKELEERKRREKEDEEAKTEKQRRLRLKLRKSILQRAASLRATESTCGDNNVKENQHDDDKPAEELSEEEKRARAATRKKLLAKQQTLLENLQAKRKKEAEEAEVERLKAAKKKDAARKAALGAQEVPGRLQEALEKVNNQATANAAAGSAVSAVRVKKEEDVVLTPEEKEKRAQQQDAIKKKQVEYLQKLADERKLKQQEEEEKQEALKAKRAKVREEALLKHEAAKAAVAAEKAAAPPPPADTAGDGDEKEKPKVNVEAMVTRLSKLKASEAQMIPEAKDFASWKKRNGLAQDTKVFCLTGWYPVIKDTLEKRGWYHNPDRNSPHFDLKWALKSDDLKNVKLNEDQLVNHFLQNTAITTKVGLLHNLRNITWFLSEDIDSFFPRAYDLNEPSDMQAYIQDFRYIHAEGMLKRLGSRCRAFLDHDVPVVVNAGVVDVVLAVCRKRLEILPDDVLDNVDAAGVEPVVTDLQWEVLQRSSMDAVGSIRAAIAYSKAVVESGGGVGGDGPPPQLTPSEQKEDARQAKKCEKMREMAFVKEKARLNGLLGQMEALTIESAQDVVALLRDLEDMCPQFHLNGGAESKNVWIVKPAGMSRGRGIRVFNQLKELLEYADVENHKECQWIVQKYIENPLLVCNRKFDIRQWVFVTSWNPLTVWFYLDCYLRFSSEEYQVDDLSDQYVHLTNNSIQKNGENFYKAYATEDGSMTVEGYNHLVLKLLASAGRLMIMRSNMWHSDDLSQYLTKRYGLDPETNESIFASKIQPRMKDIVKWSLSCVQDTIQHRKNSCELYGYDFMLDETFKPWLIEVNSSPACDYSTSVTKRYIQTGLEDILKVMLDVREYDNAKRRGFASMPKPDTGRWENIHKAEYIAKPLASFGGSDFEIKGKKLSKKSQRAINQACAATTPVPRPENVASAASLPEVEPSLDEEDDEPSVPEESAPDVLPTTLLPPDVDELL